MSNDPDNAEVMGLVGELEEVTGGMECTLVTRAMIIMACNSAAQVFEWDTEAAQRSVMECVQIAFKGLEKSISENLARGILEDSDVGI